jgi:hypothetical protein
VELQGLNGWRIDEPLPEKSKVSRPDRIHQFGGSTSGISCASLASAALLEHTRAFQKLPVWHWNTSMQQALCMK